MTAVGTAEYKTRLCCLLVLASFLLEIFKNVLDELHFTIVNKLGTVIPQPNYYIQNSIT